jgi:hypothetical protein
MRARVLALVLTFLPALAFANHYADLYVIPVAGHVTGVGGTSWRSDVSIHNFQSTPLTVELVLIESGEGAADNVTPLQTTAGSSATIPAGGTRILSDILNGHRGLAQSSGAILVGADRPFAVSSRFYAINPSGPAQGQSITPVAQFLENAIGDTNNDQATAYVPGLSANSQYRTNLGFAAGTTTGMTLEVTLRGADGASLGTRTFTIAPSSFMHLQFNTGAITSQSFNEGSATFRITSGDGAVVPYASVIDNASSAAFYVTGQFPPNTTASRVTTSVFKTVFSRRSE